MKNLLAFTAFLAAGFLLGSRRASKPVIVVADFKLRGKDLVAIQRQQAYRSQVTEAVCAGLCRADIEALQARKAAGETLTAAELKAIYLYSKTA